MAEIRSKQGDFSGALAYWKQAGDVASLLQQALQAQQARQSEHALLAYTSAWELDQETITLPLADYLIDTLEDYPTAGDVLNRAMAARPNSRNWPLWSNRLGDVLRLQEHWDEAMAAYEGTLTRSPYDWAAYIGIGWTKYERGSGLQAAMEDFRKVTTIPDTQGNGEFAIAQVLTLEKRYEDADAWFQKAIPLYPEARGRYLARANAARQSGNLVLAIKVYQETIKKFPDYAIAYYEIAQAYRLNDQPEQATAAIEEAVARISPPSAAYYTRAGKIHEWAGEPAKALEAYRQALQIDPGNPEALKGVERLGK
jgi:Tfp pilus assembly protein PilF